MQVIPSPADITAATAVFRRAGETVGFVPTMGALHEGHLSLVRRSLAECDRTVASIFLNPMQFDRAEDLAKYPSSFEADLELLAALGVDLVFTPEKAAMYPPGFATSVTVEGLVDGLCGAGRPGHFRGVTTVVAKLFNLVRPDRAYFGLKDFQQATVVKRMTEDLAMGITVVLCETVREPDGLAMSSRNRRLSAAGRERARALSRGLAAARAAFAGGERDAARLAGAAREVVDGEEGIDVEYCEVRDAAQLKLVDRVSAPVVLAVAAQVDSIRLIDNTRLDPNP